MTPVSPESPKADPGRRLSVVQRVHALFQRILPVAADRLRGAEAETAKQLDVMLRSIGEAVLATDMHGRLVRMNPAAEALLLRWAVDVVHRPIAGLFELRAHDASGAVCDPIGSLLSGGKGVERAERVVLRRHDGTDRIISFIATPIRDEGGACGGVVLVMRDMTAAHQLEEQVRRNQRVESLSQLAGGVAHDFNNLLQVVKVNLEFLADKKGLDAEACEYVGEIQQATGRAADLTRQLLALGRRQTLRRQSLDAVAVLDPFVRVLRRVMGETIHVDYHVQPPVDWVCADASQLEQVLLNLAANSREAMPLGGRLTLTLRMVELTEEDAARHTWARAGRFVCISIADTGLGMDDETLARIFEPFFTTKGLGKGAGLGLSVVLGVVQQHEGLVHASSRLGHGTCFEIYLPAVPAPAPPPAGVASSLPIRAVASDPARQCILLVEDDPSVRMVSTAILVRHGYRVIEAVDGAEACDLMRSRGSEFSLVVMDVIMPRKGGVEAAREMRQLRPDLPIVLCTGYAGSGSAELADGEDRWHLLTKPFGSHDLMRAVENASGSETPKKD